jgi:hypothetical protein
MTTRMILDPGSDDKAERTIRSRIRLRMLLVLPVAAAAAVALPACGSFVDDGAGVAGRFHLNSHPSLRFSAVTASG